MKNKKEIIKNIIIVVIIFSVVIYNFFIKKEDYEEIEISENIFTNEEKISKEIVEEKVKVHIIGEVNKPGVVELEYGARIEDAIILAGGTTNKSDLSKINLAYILEDGEKIIIPSIDDKHEEDVEIENEEGIINENNSKNEKVNINKADINELCKLSGVGEALAQKIINYRNENGKFKSIEDLRNVSGIGDKKYESLKDYISVK